MDERGWLALQIAFGADEALDAQPRDRLAARGAGTGPEAADPVVVRLSGLSAPEALAASEAAAAADLAALAARLDGFDACPLRATAMHTLLGEGPGGGLMVLADAPGEAEDRSGQVFSGPEGRLLMAMLAAIGLGREGVRLGYAIGWRPPGSRAATERERALCRPFLWRHLALARPRLLLVLGSAPAAMLRAGPKPASPRRILGQWEEIPLGEGGPGLRALTSWSLEQLIKKPAEKRTAWQHLRQVQRGLAGDFTTL